MVSSSEYGCVNGRALVFQTSPEQIASRSGIKNRINGVRDDAFNVAELLFCLMGKFPSSVITYIRQASDMQGRDVL